MFLLDRRVISANSGGERGASTRKAQNENGEGDGGSVSYRAPSPGSAIPKSTQLLYVRSDPDYRSTTKTVHRYAPGFKVREEI